MIVPRRVNVALQLYPAWYRRRFIDPYREVYGLGGIDFKNPNKSFIPSKPSSTSQNLWSGNAALFTQKGIL